jgi:hypothetical protein
VQCLMQAVWYVLSHPSHTGMSVCRPSCVLLAARQQIRTCTSSRSGVSGSTGSVPMMAAPLVKAEGPGFDGVGEPSYEVLGLFDARGAVLILSDHLPSRSDSGW